MAEPARVEVRFPVDPTEAPLVYPDTPYPDPVEDLAVEVAGPALLATIVVPLADARAWAGALFDAVSVAYREATSDPHALTDYELAGLPHPDAYDPADTLHLEGTTDQPARMRFVATITLTGQSLSDGPLRAAIVECLTGRFNTTAVAVSHGRPDPGPASAA